MGESVNPFLLHKALNFVKYIGVVDEFSVFGDLGLCC